jgi:hypothetical protein
MMKRSQHRVEPAIAVRFAALCALGLLVVACGEGTKGRGSTPTGLEQGDVAGGETSEFSGGEIAYCPEQGASFTDLDLDSEELAPWVALAQGHHETTLVWQRAFVSDALRGYEEHTSVSLDVIVLSARDVVFGDANLGYEGEGCNGRRQRQILIGVQIRTADGAVDGSLEQWLTPSNWAGDPQRRSLMTTGKADNTNFELQSFATSLELDVERSVEVRRELRVALGFDAEGVRGSLEPWIWRQEAGSETGLGVVRPLRASFPDNGCGGSPAVALDEQRAELGATPRAAYQRLRANMERRGPIRAGWRQDHPSATHDAGYAWTEVTLSGSEPKVACLDAAGVRVRASVSVKTADGLADHTQEVPVDLRNGEFYSDGGLALVPVEDLQSALGLRGFDFTGIEYAGAYVFRSGSLGAFSATKWEGSEERMMDPWLEWCEEANCEGFWCKYGVDVPGLECP